MQDRFLSALYRFSFERFPFDAAIFVQNYAGQPGTLFGIYQDLTHDYVVGVRWEAHGIL